MFSVSNYIKKLAYRSDVILPFFLIIAWLTSTSGVWIAGWEHFAMLILNVPPAFGRGEPREHLLVRHMYAHPISNTVLVVYGGFGLS